MLEHRSVEPSSDIDVVILGSDFARFSKVFSTEKMFFIQKSWNSKNNLEKAACESKSAQRLLEMFGNETQEKSVGIFLVHFILWGSIPNVIVHRTIFQHFEVKNFSISSLNIPVIKTLPLVKRSCWLPFFIVLLLHLLVIFLWCCYNVEKNSYDDSNLQGRHNVWATFGSDIAATLLQRYGTGWERHSLLT